ncbi:hypothetical protein [Rhizobium chutanense]|uniref:hypothetical protein n=1 Tax=Rhizobium chutanense TaxID=2035448 RepID=UPI000F86886B|nr:hypothetical protein [Rhizobium chutanense]
MQQAWDISRNGRASLFDRDKSFTTEPRFLSGAQRMLERFESLHISQSVPISEIMQKSEIDDNGFAEALAAWYTANHSSRNTCCI